MEKKILSCIPSLLLATINPSNTVSSEEFERHFSRYVGVKHAVFTNSGRDALYLALKSLSLPKGSKVWLPTFSCIHVINPLLRLGLTPMLADIEENTFNMNRSRAQRQPSALRNLASSNCGGIKLKRR